MTDGLGRAIKIINEEIEIAKEINPQMALGMIQVKNVIELELKKYRKKQY